MRFRSKKKGIFIVLRLFTRQFQTNAKQRKRTCLFIAIA